MLTLQDTLNTPAIQRNTAKCKNSQGAIDLINEAARRLMRRGDWFDTAVPIFVCVYNGCLVMPRYVQQVRKINICNREIPVRNGWYEMPAYNQNYCNWGSWLGSWTGPTTGLSQQASSPVFQDVMGDGRLIRAYPRCQADIGKTMRFFGQDNNGQPLVTVDPSTGAITQGALLTIASPFGSTSSFVRHIDYVVRDTTTMMVDCYAYNATTNLLEELAHYEPSETTPTYTRYKLSIHWPNTASGSVQPNCCGNQRGVVMMVKLRFIEAQNPNDLVLVPCVDALKLMIMAITREDAGDRNEARAFERDAIEVMNRELENNSPDDQFSVAVYSGSLGTRSNQCF